MAARRCPTGSRPRWARRARRCSGGQRQRIAAARLLLCDARFLVFDEPTTHLDAAGAEELLTRLAGLAREQRRGVLVITHERGRLAAFDEVWQLAEGVLVPG